MILKSIPGEFLRYKKLAEGAIAQVPDNELARVVGDDNNSIQVIACHISGNLKSRFTDFLTSDGEKLWRNRDGEFEERALTKAQLLNVWEEGWQVLLEALSELSDADLDTDVSIRGQALSVVEALHRSLAHLSYHVGQIVLMARITAGSDWQTLSIARDKSGEYNSNPTRERPPGQS